MQSPAAVNSGKPYTSAKGGFSVALPAGFVEQKRKATLPDGPLDLMVASRKRGVALLSVAYGDLAAEATDPEATLAAARDDILAPYKCKAAEERPIALGDAAGCEFRFEIPKQIVAGGAVGRARVFLAGKRLYEIVAVQSNADAQTKSGELLGFLDSFRVTGERSAKVAARVPERTEEGVYTSKRWSYQVRFPGQAKVQEFPGDAAIDKRPYHIASFKEGTHTFAVLCQPSANPLTFTASLDAILGARNGSVGKGKILESRDVRSGEMRGKEHAAEADVPLLPPGTFKKFRTFATGNLIYAVIYTETTPNGPRDRGDAFLESFKVLAPAPFAPEDFKLPVQWSVVNLPGAGNGSISLPGTPKATRQDPGPGGKSYPSENLVGNYGGCAFFASVVTLPASHGKMSEQEYEELGRGLANLKEAGSLKKQNITVKGRPGRHFSTNGKNERGVIVRIEAKFLEANGRVIALIAFTPLGFEYEPLIKGFFDSYTPSAK